MGSTMRKAFPAWKETKDSRDLPESEFTTVGDPTCTELSDDWTLAVLFNTG